jgi:dissimilatory sulfite reductase related protein
MAFEVGGKTFETDEEGFLLDPHIWDESLAQHIAQDEKLDLARHAGR